MKLLRKLLLGCALFICLLPLTMTGAAADNMAEEISSVGLVRSIQGITNTEVLFDNSTYFRQDIYVPSSLTLTSDRGIGSVYFSFGKGDIPFTITDLDTNASADIPGEMYMHRFVDVVAILGVPARNLKIDFPGETSLCELNVFTEGQVPDWVQRWEPPVEGGADLVLFSTHDDDTHLFFAGILPYYAGELNYKVQVVFMTNHWQEPYRFHELLDGLWAVGVHTYPVAGTFADFNLDQSAQGTYNIYANIGTTKDMLLSYVVENVRRFRPKVAVGHDIFGEYGHGMHMVYTDLLMQACEISNDPTAFPESAEKYGTWDMPKVYLHLYDQNKIVTNWDTPLEKFGGMTAYEVSRDLGFPCHVTQYNDFYWYFRGYNSAAEVALYNPCQYGLYYSTVGPDENKNDFFENVTTYEEDEAMAAMAEPVIVETPAEPEPEAAPEPTPAPAAAEPTPVPEAPSPTPAPEAQQQATRNEGAGLHFSFDMLPYIAVALLAMSLVIIVILIKTR